MFGHLSCFKKLLYDVLVTYTLENYVILLINATTIHLIKKIVKNML